MSQQQSSKHGPAVDDALQDERHQASVGVRHDDRPDDDPIFQDEAVQDPPRPDQDSVEVEPREDGEASPD
jgi:hypothetical protein